MASKEQIDQALQYLATLNPLQQTQYLSSPKLPPDVRDELAHRLAPYEMEQVIKSPIGQMVGSKANWILEKFQRPTEAMLARHAGRSGWQTFKHGESYDQYIADMDNATKDWIRTFGDAKDVQTYENWPEWKKTLMQGGVSFLYDPTVVFGKLGAGEHLVTSLEKLGLPSAMKLASVVERYSPAIAKAPLVRGKSALDIAGMVPRGLHQLLSVDAQHKRALASALGPKWLERYEKLYGSRAAAQSTVNHVSNEFDTRFRDIVNKLTPKQESLVYKAIDLGKVNKLPAALQGPAQKIEHLTDSLAYIEGDPEVVAKLKAMGYTPEDWVSKLKSLGSPRVAQTAKQFRGRYIPGRAPGPKELPAGRTVKSGLFTREGQPFLKPRPNIPTTAKFNPAETREAFRQRFVATGKNIAEGQVQRQFGNLAPSQEFASFFQRETPTGVSGSRELLQFNKTIQDLEKGNLFITPIGHEKNIAVLQAARNPASLIPGMYHYARTAFMPESKRFDYFKKAIMAGAVQTGETGDRSSAFAQGLHTIADAIAGRKSQAPLFDMARKALASPFKLAGKYYDLVGDQLWKFDDAQKAAAFENELAKGYSTDRAAMRVNATLVDYNQRSELAEGLSTVAPFATYRTKAPMAIARSAIEHPENISNLTRMAPPVTGGRTKGTKPGFQTAMTTPISETTELLTDPWAAARSTLGQVPKAALNLLNLQPRDKGQQYWIYGGQNKFKQPTLPQRAQDTARYLQLQAPFYGQYRAYQGKGLFPNQSGIEQLLSGQTGIRQTPVAPPKKVTKTGLERDSFVESYMKQNPGRSEWDADRAFNLLKGFNVLP